MTQLRVTPSIAPHRRGGLVFSTKTPIVVADLSTLTALQLAQLGADKALLLEQSADGTTWSSYSPPAVPNPSAAILAGTTASTTTIGPYVPILDQPITLTLSGSWTGSVQLLRSTDAGATKLPLTYGDGSAKPVWTGNLNAIVGEESVADATYYLAVTIASGSLAYRLEQ